MVEAAGIEPASEWVSPLHTHASPLLPLSDSLVGQWRGLFGLSRKSQTICPGMSTSRHRRVTISRSSQARSTFYDPHPDVVENSGVLEVSLFRQPSPWPEPKPRHEQRRSPYQVCWQLMRFPDDLRGQPGFLGVSHRFQLHPSKPVAPVFKEHVAASSSVRYLISTLSGVLLVPFGHRRCRGHVPSGTPQQDHITTTRSQCGRKISAGLSRLSPISYISTDYLTVLRSPSSVKVRFSQTPFRVSGRLSGLSGVG